MFFLRKSYCYLSTSDPSLIDRPQKLHEIKTGPTFLRDHKHLRAGVSDRDCTMVTHLSAKAPRITFRKTKAPYLTSGACQQEIYCISPYERTCSGKIFTMSLGQDRRYMPQARLSICTHRHNTSQAIRESVVCCQLLVRVTQQSLMQSMEPRMQHQRQECKLYLFQVIGLTQNFDKINQDDICVINLGGKMNYNGMSS